jgi:predicted TIM-barrel fold metal-dependent hydrolase
MIIDAHHHFMPKALYEQYGPLDKPTWRYNDPALEFTFYHKLYEPDVHLKDMDEAGIDVAVLSLAQWNLKGIETCRIINDGMARVAREHPDRFIGCIQLPIHEGSVAIQELHRGLDLGLKAPAIMSSCLDIAFDDERMFPFYDEVSRLGLPIVVHASLFPKGAESSYTIGRTLSRAYDISGAALRIIYKVFQKWPDLKFILPHMGGVLPMMKGRVMAFFEPPSELGFKLEYPQDIRPLPKTLNELESTGAVPYFNSLFDRLYFDTAGASGWMPAVQATVNAYQAHQIMFGTDYPMEIHTGADKKWFIENIRAMSIPEADKEAILGGNFARVFGMNM